MADDYKEPELVNATSVANLTSKETSALHDLLRNFRHKRGERHDASYLDRYIVSHPQAADRSALDGHLTGSILILDPKQRCLLTLHRKYRQWQQLGGHADGNFNLLAVAAREGLEESGLDQFLIDPVPIDVDVHDAGCFRDSSVVRRHFDICFAGKV